MIFPDLNDMEEDNLGRLSIFCFPRHPKSSKYLVSRCLEPLKTIKTEVFGVQTPTHKVFGCLGFDYLEDHPSW